jgi:hypothetical protein
MVLLFTINFGSGVGITDKSKLDWDYGYLEDVEFSKYKGKNFISIYSEKYNKKRYFSTHSRINESYLKKKIIEDHYYDRKIKIGSKLGWMDDTAEAPSTGMVTYVIHYKDYVVLDFEDSSNLFQKGAKSFDCIFNSIVFLLNVPYFYYLLLFFYTKLYGRCK